MTGANKKFFTQLEAFFTFFSETWTGEEKVA